MRRATADFHSRQKYFQAIEQVLNRLHHQNSFQQQFNILRVEEVIADCEGSERSHTGNQVQPFQLNSKIEGIKWDCVHVYDAVVWCITAVPVHFRNQIFIMCN